jgi:hypothetical protein
MAWKVVGWPAAGWRLGSNVGVASGRRRLGRWCLAGDGLQRGMGGGGLQRGMRWSEIVVVAAVFFFPSGMRHGVRVGRVLLFPRGSARCCTGNTLYLQGLVGYTCHTLLLSTRRYRVPVVSVSADRIRLPSNPARVQSPLEPMRTERRVHSSTTIAFWWHASWQSFASHLFAREDIFISSINCTIYGPFV